MAVCRLSEPASGHWLACAGWRPLANGPLRRTASCAARVSLSAWPAGAEAEARGSARRPGRPARRGTRRWACPARAESRKCRKEEVGTARLRSRAGQGPAPGPGLPSPAPARQRRRRVRGGPMARAPIHAFPAIPGPASTAPPGRCKKAGQGGGSAEQGFPRMKAMAGTYSRRARLLRLHIHTATHASRGSQPSPPSRSACRQASQDGRGTGAGPIRSPGAGTSAPAPWTSRTPVIP